METMARAFLWRYRLSGNFHGWLIFTIKFSQLGLIFVDACTHACYDIVLYNRAYFACLIFTVRQSSTKTRENWTPRKLSVIYSTSVCATHASLIEGEFPGHVHVKVILYICYRCSPPQLVKFNKRIRRVFHNLLSTAVAETLRVTACMSSRSGLALSSSKQVK